MMQQDVEELRARSEAAFKTRHVHKQHAPPAMREYRAAEQAEREKMKRLREQRLALATVAPEYRSS